MVVTSSLGPITGLVIADTIGMEADRSIERISMDATTGIKYLLFIAFHS
jgi:predicted exporter